MLECTRDGRFVNWCKPSFKLHNFFQYRHKQSKSWLFFFLQIYFVELILCQRRVLFEYFLLCACRFFFYFYILRSFHWFSSVWPRVSITPRHALDRWWRERERNEEVHTSINDSVRYLHIDSNVYRFMSNSLLQFNTHWWCR